VTAPARRPARGQSAAHLVAYLRLMRAVGRRYERVETILRNLDRFAATEPAGEVLLTRELLGRWLASTPHLAPGTLRGHASAARGFCRYLARVEPRTHIPDRSLYPARLPQFRPHVFSRVRLAHYPRASSETASAAAARPATWTGRRRSPSTTRASTTVTPGYRAVMTATIERSPDRTASRKAKFAKALRAPNQWRAPSVEVSCRCAGAGS